MPIAPNKIRVSVVLEKTDKAALEKLAEDDDRSLNYMINKAVKEYIEKASKK